MADVTAYVTEFIRAKAYPGMHGLRLSPPEVASLGIQHLASAGFIESDSIVNGGVVDESAYCLTAIAMQRLICGHRLQKP